MTLTEEDPAQGQQPTKGCCLLVVHSLTSNTGRIGRALMKRGYRLERCCPNAGEPLPGSMQRYAATVVFGGPMSANDDGLHAGIAAELRWIPKVLESETPFLGVCLGAQLLARALGAAVQPHPEGEVEVGYYPIEPTDAGRGLFDAPMHVYHWHKEGFDIPSGGTLTASGRAFPNQAFRYAANAHGIQFHPEVTLDMVREWSSSESPSASMPGAQCAKQQLDGHARYDKALGEWLASFLDEWLGDSPRGRKADRRSPQTPHQATG